MAEHIPLNAFRAFEAAARTGSFVSAGGELGVSAAAVSQQVKSLESTIGKTLFLRQGNKITLTEAGRALYPRLESVFADLTSLTREFGSARQASRLVVSALPSLAELWLTPMLASYDGRDQIDLRVETDPVDFARSGTHLRITYGAHYYPDHHVEVLFRDSYIAVAAPDFAAQIKDNPELLADGGLIHTHWGPDYVNQPEWTQWFTAAGAPRHPSPATGIRTGQTSLSVIAARTGVGAALVPARMAAWEIATGTLVRIGTAAVPLTWDYVLVYPEAYARRGRMRNFCAHLISCAASDI